MNLPDKERPIPQQHQERHKSPILLTYSRRPKPKPQSPLPTSSVSVPEPPASSIPRKRRFLPNLSECHACGFRIDLNDGKNRLQTLYSEWRIVLLCKKCLNRVESSVVCSYCFDETACKDCFVCNMCKRSVHRDCFLKYRCVPPWSYSCRGEEFSVCVDCWVPKQVMGSLNRRLKRKRRVRKSDGFDRKSDNSRASGKGNGVVLDQGGLENVVDHVAGRKTETVVGGKKKAKKNGASRTVVLVATGDLNTVARRDKEDDSRGGDKMIDDSGFAFELHRLVTSSPRISKSNEAVQRIGESKDVGFAGVSGSLCLSINGKIQICCSNELCENNADESVSESSLLARTSCCDPTVALNSKEAEGIGDKHSSQKDSKSLLTYSRRNKSMNKEGEGRGSDGVALDVHIHETQAESMKPVDERSIYDADRFRLKYHRRKSILNRIQDCGDMIVQATDIHLQTRTETPPAGLLSNCSNLSRTISTALMSNMAPLQASSCTAGLLRDQS